MYEELAKEILEMLKLEIGKDVDEHAIPNISMLIQARVTSRLAKTLVMPKIKRVRIVKGSFRGDGWFSKMLGQTIEVCEMDNETLRKYNPDGSPMYILAEDYLKAFVPTKKYKKGIKIIRKKYCEDVV